MEEEKKEHEEHHENHKKRDLTDKVRKNPWMLSTFVCAALILILLVSSFFGGFTGHSISANAAGQKLVKFYQSMGVQNITLDSVSEISGIYQVNIKYQGQTIPLYITKDGKNVITSLNPTETEETTNENTDTNVEIPKSAKPSVELYVFTYCPYGTQAEKGMIPAIKLLGDGVNFKIKQIGAMHGDHEKLEAERQLCIDKYYPTKFLDYVEKFITDSAIGNCNGDAACLTPKITTIYATLGIDATKINTCISKEAEAMYDAEVSNAQSKGISGSPTLVINGVQIPTSSDYKYYTFNDLQIPFARDSNTYKEMICSLFNNAPSACSTSLSTTAPSAGFGASTGSSTAASCS
jgi:protein-disulfide isomerase